MGQASRANAARRDTLNAQVFWDKCGVCAEDHPTLAAPSDRLPRLSVCQRCCVADVARLMRSHPETVRMLSTVRVLQGLPVVREVESRLADLHAPTEVEWKDLGRPQEEVPHGDAVGRT